MAVAVVVEACMYGYQYFIRGMHIVSGLSCDFHVQTRATAMIMMMMMMMIKAMF